MLNNYEFWGWRKLLAPKRVESRDREILYKNRVVKMWLKNKWILLHVSPCGVVRPNNGPPSSHARAHTHTHTRTQTWNGTTFCNSPSLIILTGCLYMHVHKCEFVFYRVSFYIWEGVWKFLISTTFKMMFVSWFASGPPTKINTSAVLVIPPDVFQNALYFICFPQVIDCSSVGLTARCSSRPYPSRILSSL